MNNTLYPGRKQPLALRIWHSKYIYLMLLPGILYFAIFHYAPMYGLVLAFKKYSARLGIMGSPWIGLDNFRRLFITAGAKRAIINTLVISFERLLFQFPIPIILAILIDEMPQGGFKKAYQTVYTFPHFLSWVVVGTIVINLFSNAGSVNRLISQLGGEAIPFLGSKELARPMLYITANWKGMGWASIIYLAAIGDDNGICTKDDNGVCEGTSKKYGRLPSPIAERHQFKRLTLFGSYARSEATEKAILISVPMCPRISACSVWVPCKAIWRKPFAKRLT